MSYTNGFDFSQLNEEDYNMHATTRKEGKNAWCRILHYSVEELEKLIGEDEMLHFDSRLPILSHEFTGMNEQVVDGNVTMGKFWPKVATYPSFIHSPLRVLNKIDSTFFPKAVKELEYIITKGDMTFTRDFPLGYSGVDNFPFLLSRAKARVIIILVNGNAFGENKQCGIISKDGFASYLPYEILGKVYPIIMIDTENLEASFLGKKDCDAQIIRAYQSDILELFAYAIMECHYLLQKDKWSIPVLQSLSPELVIDEHRQYAEAFAKRYIENK